MGQSLSWMAVVLPEVGQAALYSVSEEACRLDRDPRNNPPHVGFATPIPTYVCPSDGRAVPLTDGFGRTVAVTSYVGVLGAHNAATRRMQPGVLASRPGNRLTDVTDGTAQTVMVGERPAPDSLQAGWWYPGFDAVPDAGYQGPNNFLDVGEVILPFHDPACVTARRQYGPGRLDNPCDRYHFWSLHPGGGNWLFADGSVRFLTYAAGSILPTLATCDGGEVVEAP